MKNGRVGNWSSGEVVELGSGFFGKCLKDVHSGVTKKITARISRSQALPGNAYFLKNSSFEYMFLITWR